jgi:hypothetical protein
MKMLVVALAVLGLVACGPSSCDNERCQVAVGTGIDPWTGRVVVAMTNVCVCLDAPKETVG